MRLGAHVSISGSLDLAIDRAVAMGCDCLQIFYGSPRQWRKSVYPDDVIERFIQKRRAAGLDPLVAHAAYLVNPGTPDRDLRRRSVASLLATLRGVERLGGLGVITHLGSRLSSPKGAALRRIATAVRQILGATERAVVLIENSAGSGGTLGATFDDLAAVLDGVHGDARVGVCLDTAHLFASGWDLRTPAGIEEMIAAADRAVGWDRVRVLHLNDSQGALGSRRDRHANIGEGLIGSGGFRALLAHPRLRALPGIIETPGFNHAGPDAKNLARLRRLGGQRWKPTGSLR
ncbi:MAG: deoxyribonuclease IV [Armatimonadetes bacterium]|nr:deoxyribonuclease IV [Armatimonadota bacterium]